MVGDLESGWYLEGSDGRGQPLRLLLGETELARSYLGITFGRHPALCQRVIEDASVSRRHFRIGRNAAGAFIEDVNSLNGTNLDGVPLKPFEPTALSPGQTLSLGRVTLKLARLEDAPAGA